MSIAKIMLVIWCFVAGAAAAFTMGTFVLPCDRNLAVYAGRRFGFRDAHAPWRICGQSAAAAWLKNVPNRFVSCALSSGDSESEFDEAPKR